MTAAIEGPGADPRRGRVWPERLWRDARLGVRLWRRRPGAPLVGVLSLGIAIGVVVAIFELLATLYWRPPFATAAAGLFRVAETHGGEATAAGSFPLEAWRELRSTATAVEDLAAEQAVWVWSPNLDGRGVPAELDGGLATANYFDVLGLEPALGRLFAEGEDDAAGAPEVAVLGHRLWRKRFRSDRAVIGRVLPLNGRRVTVIGVAPTGFAGSSAGDTRDLWLVANGRERRDELARVGGETFRLVGRLRPATSIAQASAEIDTLAAPLLPASDEGRERAVLSLEPLRGVAVARREALGKTPLLGAASALSLWLLACLNVAGLLSSRNSDRRRELVMRLALGGSRRALAAQLFAETLVLAAAGGVAALPFAWGAGELLARWYGYRLPGLELDAGFGSFAVAALLALAAGVVAGAPSAWAASRAALSAVGTAAWGVQRLRARFVSGTALVVGQVCLSLALVAAAAIMARSVGDLLASGGSRPADVLHYRLRPSRVGYDVAAAKRYHERLLEAVTEFPAVRSAALARVGPDRGWCCPIAVAVPGRLAERAEDELLVDHNHVSTDYLRTIGIAVLHGRDFGPGDTVGAPAVAIVNRALSERLWPGADPLDRRVVAGGRDYLVVGLAPDLLASRPGEAPVPYLWLALAQHELVDVRLYARFDRGATASRHAFRQGLVAVDPDVHIGQEGTLRERTLLQHAEERTLSGVLQACAILALALSSLGLYVQVAQSVARRTREIGLRLALGATTRGVIGMVVRQGLATVAAGIALGLIATSAQGRLLQGYLHGVSAGEPSLLMAAILVVLAAGGIAAYVPARRASRVDPWRVLRHE